MGNRGDSYEILVTPEYLKETAQTMESLLKKALEGYRSVSETAVATKSCFQGKCADQIRKRIIKRAGEGVELMEEIQSFPQRLLLIADEYAAAERENKDAANRN